MSCSDKLAVSRGQGPSDWVTCKDSPCEFSRLQIALADHAAKSSGDHYLWFFFFPGGVYLFFFCRRPIMPLGGITKKHAWLTRSGSPSRPPRCPAPRSQAHGAPLGPQVCPQGSQPGSAVSQLCDSGQLF